MWEILTNWLFVCVCVCEMFEVCQFMFCSETGLQCVVCLYFLMIDVC